MAPCPLHGDIAVPGLIRTNAGSSPSTSYASSRSVNPCLNSLHADRLFHPIQDSGFHCVCLQGAKSEKLCQVVGPVLVHLQGCVHSVQYIRSTHTHTHQAFLTPACTVHRVRWNYDWASPGISCKNPCRLTMHKPLPSSHWPVPFRLCPVPCCLQGIRSPSSPFPDTFQAIVHAMSIAAGQKSPGRSSSSRSCSSRPRRSSGSPWCFVWHITQKTQNKFVQFYIYCIHISRVQNAENTFLFHVGRSVLLQPSIHTWCISP